MGNLKQEAQNYTAPATKTIDELEKVSTELDVVEKEYQDSEGKPFKVKIVNVDGQDYRVPVSVLNSLKAILEENQNLQFFKVKKEGTGLKTSYTVIQLS